MEPNLASVLALAGTAAITVTLAALAPSDAHADDIAMDNTTFTSNKSRAETRSELLNRTVAPTMNPDELALQNNYQPPIKSNVTRDQVQAEYKASRESVRRLLAEDSGSSYFANPASPTATMGASPR